MLSRSAIAKPPRHLLALAAIGLGVLALPVEAGTPFCALRDPSSQIFQMNPHATAYRSIIKKIDLSVRRRVMERVGFDLHARELGQHTLYVALNRKEPIGLVHVRSELSDWGLVEVAWALDLDLRIVDFRFQRCRGPACDSAEHDESLGQSLRGQGLEDLRARLGRRATSAAKEPGSDAAKMLETLVRSALKTIAVTEVAWGDEIDRLRRPSRPSSGGGGGL